MTGPHGEERTSERRKGCRWTRRGGSSSYVPFESLVPAWPGYMYVPLSYTPIIVPLIIYNWRPRLIGFDRRSIASSYVTCAHVGLLVPCARMLRFEEFGLVVLEAQLRSAGRGKRFARNSVHSHRTISFAFNFVLSLDIVIGSRDNARIF